MNKEIIENMYSNNNFTNKTKELSTSNKENSVTLHKTTDLYVYFKQGKNTLTIPTYKNIQSILADNKNMKNKISVLERKISNIETILNNTVRQVNSINDSKNNFVKRRIF